MLNYPIKNILVPVDFSENSWNALHYTVELFKRVPCDFHILHVADLGEMDIEAARLFSFTKSFQKAEKINKKELLTTFLTKANDLFGNKRHRFLAQMEHGSLIDSIKRQLSEKNIDLIAMGTRGAGTMKSKVIGSNAGAIITRIRCNTLVVPEQARFNPLKSITFPTDFNIFYSPRILRSLSEILNLHGSNLSVVHFANGKGEEHFTEDQNSTKAYLLDYLDEVYPKRHSYQVVRNKKMINAIQDFVQEEKIDMIAIIARNLNFLQQLFFDSRVERISFHTTVPMFIIHE